MKKLIYFISIITTLLIVGAACNGDSYQKRLDKQKKAIENFLADKGIEVLKEYPSNHKFGKNQYYLEGSTGVYLQVVEPGLLDEAPTVEERLEIKMRFDSVYAMVENKWYVGNTDNYSTPITFEYGDAATYSMGKKGTDYEKYYMSPACVLPLQKGVGKKAVVNLIVPFANGSSYQTSYYEPFFYEGLTYEFHRQMPEEGTEESEN